MIAYWLGAITGAVLFAFIWSRLWIRLGKKLVKVAPKRIYLAYAMAWATAIVWGAFGFADGGPPNWSRALLGYTPALALWLVFDLIRARGKTT